MQFNGNLDVFLDKNASNNKREKAFKHIQRLAEMLDFILHYYTGYIIQYGNNRNILYEGPIREYVESIGTEIMDYFVLMSMSANPKFEIIPQGSPVSQFGYYYY